MRFKNNILDDAAVRRAIIRLAHEIAEQNSPKGLCVIGVQRRGVVLAHAISDVIKTVSNTDIPVGMVDVSAFRDDLELLKEPPIVNKTDVSFSLKNKTVVVVDDVICTARTARAAINAVFALGRPKAVRLAVLIDRGFRELPINPNYVGKFVETSRDEIISVNCLAIDGKDSVDLYEL